jgi:hypothetical protein
MDGPVDFLPHQLAPFRVGSPRLIMVGIAGAVIAAGLGWHFLQYLWHAMGAVRYPFGMDYSEGVTWQQALLITGPRMYGDISRFPFIVFHYPPVYFLVVRALAATGIDMLVAGRSISLVSTLAVGAVVGRLAFLAISIRIGRTARFTGSAIAVLTVFCYEPIVVSSPLMQVDMLAVALSFLGVLCVVTSVGQPWRLTAGSVLFLLAIFTRQTSIAAPLAALPVMLTVNPRRTAATSLTALVLLLLLNAATGDGFLRHILVYNFDHYQFSSIVDGIVQQRHHAIFLLFTVAGVISTWRRLARERHWPDRQAFARDVAESMVVRCMLIATLYLIVTTIMIVTIDTSPNDLIEGMCVWSVIIGVFVASTIDHALGRAKQTLTVPIAISLGWLLAVQMLIMPTANGEYQIVTAAYIQDLESLRSRIANSQGPVLSDDIVLLLRAGKQVPWEPATFAALASRGRWNQRLIVDRIEAHEFAMIVTLGRPETRSYDSRYTPEVSHAIETAYPHTERVAGRTIHLPPD